MILSGNKRNTRSHLKGQAGTTVGAILIIVIFLTFFSVYLYQANNEIQNNIRLNLESLEALKLKSTFSLFKTSLDNTWFISTVQAVFLTGDEGLGCGYDNALLGLGYWYKFNPGNSRSFTSDGLATLSGKYNADKNPQICYPTDNDVKEYVNKKLVEGGYLNLRMMKPEDAGGVSITIPRKSDGSVDATIQINMDSSRVESIFSQRITAERGTGKIDAQTQSTSSVTTSLSLMAAAGRNAISTLLTLGVSHPTYQTTNKAGYESLIKSLVENAIRSASSSITATANTNVNAEVDMRAADDLTSGIVPSKQGLILHYKATAIYTEKEGRYYYHNEPANKFEKRPISMQYIAEDYLSALNCIEHEPNPPAPEFFSWTRSNDMACCAGYLLTCNIDIPNLAAEQKIPLNGQADDNIFPQSLCNGILSGDALKCTPNGFQVG